MSVALVNGVELHFVDHGEGEPVVFVHGGLADYRELLPAARALPSGYRTVNYSRRYSFPNKNPPATSEHTMATDVADLAALIEAFELGPVHISGVSYGAFVSLMLALDRPALVKTVTAGEPPLLHWLLDIEGGQALHDEFHRSVMAPSAAAFASGDPDRALSIAVDHFIGPGAFEASPPEVRQMLVSNVEDWKAITTAPGALPKISREQVASISVPVLLISGGSSAGIHRLIDAELARVIPQVERIIIPDATHEAWVERPAECAAAIAAFLGKQGC